MAADSEGKPEWELKWEADQRKEFQTDPAMWLRQEFASVIKRIDEQREGQADQAKNLVQNLAESLAIHVEHRRDALILWMGILTAIALASAGLWLGFGVVGLLVLWVWWRPRAGWKQVWRLQLCSAKKSKISTQLRRHNVTSAQDAPHGFLRTTVPNPAGL